MYVLSNHIVHLKLFSVICKLYPIKAEKDIKDGSCIFFNGIDMCSVTKLSGLRFFKKYCSYVMSTLIPFKLEKYFKSCLQFHA